jgi:hypothetical protein
MPLLTCNRRNPPRPVRFAGLLAFSRCTFGDARNRRRGIGRSVSIHLPQAEIFTTRLDNAKTRVYSRDTGLFSTPDPNLEGEVRQEAERQLQSAALQDGILKSADKNARQTLTSMLTGLGFGNVEIR